MWSERCRYLACALPGPLQRLNLFLQVTLTERVPQLRVRVLVSLIGCAARTRLLWWTQKRQFALLNLCWWRVVLRVRLAKGWLLYAVS